MVQGLIGAGLTSPGKLDGMCLWVGLWMVWMQGWHEEKACVCVYHDLGNWLRSGEETG